MIVPWSQEIAKYCKEQRYILLSQCWKEFFAWHQEGAQIQLGHEPVPLLQLHRLRVITLKLQQSLGALVEILGHEPPTAWIDPFKQLLSEAQALVDKEGSEKKDASLTKLQIACKDGGKLSCKGKEWKTAHDVKSFAALVALAKKSILQHSPMDYSDCMKNLMEACLGNMSCRTQEKERLWRQLVLPNPPLQTRVC